MKFCPMQFHFTKNESINESFYKNDSFLNRLEVWEKLLQLKLIFEIMQQELI